MKILFSLIYMLLSICLSAIDLTLPVSAAHNATNNLSLLLDTPAVSVTNPALCSPGLESSATYLFGMSELPLYNFHASYKFSHLGIHLGNSYLNHNFYQESCSQLTLNYHLSAFSIGIAGRHLYNKVKNYHHKSILLVDSGISWKNKNISSALSVRNLTHSSFLDTQLPVIYLWETSLSVSNKSKLAIGLEKEKDFDFSFKMGATYTPFRLLSILTSYQYEPDRIGVGTIFTLKSWQITYSVRTHQYLNLTHYISVCYVFNK